MRANQSFQEAPVTAQLTFDKDSYNTTTYKHIDNGFGLQQGETPAAYLAKKTQDLEFIIKALGTNDFITIESDYLAPQKITYNDTKSEIIPASGNTPAYTQANLKQDFNSLLGNDDEKIAPLSGFKSELKNKGWAIAENKDVNNVYVIYNAKKFPTQQKTIASQDKKAFAVTFFPPFKENAKGDDIPTGPQVTLCAFSSGANLQTFEKQLLKEFGTTNIIFTGYSDQRPNFLHTDARTSKLKLENNAWNITPGTHAFGANSTKSEVTITIQPGKVFALNNNVVEFVDNQNQPVTYTISKAAADKLALLKPVNLFAANAPLAQSPSTPIRNQANPDQKGPSQFAQAQADLAKRGGVPEGAGRQLLNDGDIAALPPLKNQQNDRGNANNNAGKAAFGPIPPIPQGGQGPNQQGGGAPFTAPQAQPNQQGGQGLNQLNQQQLLQQAQQLAAQQQQQQPQQQPQQIPQGLQLLVIPKEFGTQANLGALALDYIESIKGNKDIATQTSAFDALNQVAETLRVTDPSQAGKQLRVRYVQKEGTVDIGGKTYYECTLPKAATPNNSFYVNYTQNGVISEVLIGAEANCLLFVKPILNSRPGTVINCTQTVIANMTPQSPAYFDIKSANNISPVRQAAPQQQPLFGQQQQQPQQGFAPFNAQPPAYGTPSNVQLPFAQQPQNPYAAPLGLAPAPANNNAGYPQQGQFGGYANNAPAPAGYGAQLPQPQAPNAGGYGQMVQNQQQQRQGQMKAPAAWL
jgi:hypothetical protein